MAIFYATVEDVRDALEEKASAYDLAQVKRALALATDDVDDAANLASGAFRPAYATKYFRWPAPQTGSYYRLWLDGNRLISVTQLISAGSVISSLDYYLEPQEYGPPYDRIEIDLSSSSSFGYSTSTPQRAITVTGLWGWGNEQSPVGTLSVGVNDSVTAMTVTDGTIGVGDHLTLGSEIVIVTAKSFADSTQTINAELAALASATTVAVDDGTKFTAGETILIGSERMLVLDIAGNNLTVKRAVDGTVLALQANASALYWQHALTVTRGAQGSTKAAHLADVAITRHVVPGAVYELAVASACAALLGERSAYASQVGPGSSPAERSGGGNLRILRELVATAYGRPVRTRVI